MELLPVLAFSLVLFTAVLAQNLTERTPLCKAPTNAPVKLEKVINQCQDEIKYALLREALSVLGESVTQNRPNARGKRDLFNNEEKRIAGCLLQCVYRKMKALDSNGIPTPTGLVKIYSEGVSDRNYYLATIQSVQQCLAQELKERNGNPDLIKTEGYTCDVAYDIFNCVSEQIELLCGSTP
uniref:OBP2 n=1 Tax=Corythucha ciliata TaxID=369451 RepID=A0A3G2YUX7_CORCT|nr:OBP2 [Corythucha ciliata]